MLLLLGLPTLDDPFLSLGTGERMVVLLRGEQRMVLHRSGVNAVLRMFVLTIGDGLTFSEFFRVVVGHDFPRAEARGLLGP